MRPEDRGDLLADVARGPAVGDGGELVRADPAGEAADRISAQAAADLGKERIDRAFAGARAQLLDAVELDEVERRVGAQCLGLLQAGEHRFLERILVEQIVVAGGRLGEGRAQRRDREMDRAAHERHAAAAQRDAGRFSVRPHHAQCDRLHATAAVEAPDRGADHGPVAGGKESEEIAAGERGDAASGQAVGSADGEADAQRGIHLDQQIGGGEGESEKAVALVLERLALRRSVTRRSGF